MDGATGCTGSPALTWKTRETGAWKVILASMKAVDTVTRSGARSKLE